MVSLTSLTQASHHFIWEYFFKLWAKSSAQQLECTPSQHLLTMIAPFPGPPSPQFFLSYCTSKQRSTWRRRARNKANISCCYTRQGCTIIAENFWGTELSQNARFCGYLQKFFSAKFGGVASFSCTSKQTVKVLSTKVSHYTVHTEMLETWDLSSVLHMSGHSKRWYIYIQVYRIAGNLRGRKLSQIGEK